MKNKNETFDITDDVIEFIFSKYDEIGLDPQKGYDKILIAFKKIEVEGIRGLYKRMWKKFPYSANYETSQSTDDSQAKIRRLVNN